MVADNEIQIVLSLEEATALMAFFSEIGGSPHHSLRGFADSMGGKLLEKGIFSDYLQDLRERDRYYKDNSATSGRFLTAVEKNRQRVAAVGAAAPNKASDELVKRLVCEGKLATARQVVADLLKDHSTSSIARAREWLK